MMSDWRMWPAYLFKIEEANDLSNSLIKVLTADAVYQIDVDPN
jgi:hypothetical protein